MNKYIENENDVVGYLALAYYLLSVKDVPGNNVILEAINRCGDHETRIFRAAAHHGLQVYTEKSIDTKMDAIRSSVTQSAYADTLKTTYTQLLSDQEAGHAKMEAGFAQVIGAIDSSGNPWRQI